jgi:flagellin-like protein
MHANCRGAPRRPRAATGGRWGRFVRFAKTLPPKYLALELTAGLIALFMVLGALPIITWLAYRVPTFPAWAAFLVAPSALRTPRLVWKRGVSPLAATLILVLVTLVLALVLYLLEVRFFNV